MQNLPKRKSENNSLSKCKNRLKDGDA